MASFLERLAKTAIHKETFQLSSREVFQNSKSLSGVLATSGTVVGYVYPHAPLELLLAHGITPSLIWADRKVQSGFEASLQTFACSLTRNLFSQRSNGGLSSLSGILFPGNTCDSLQNVADVWRHRFPEDKIFRLTYPAARLDEDAVSFLAEELRLLSDSLKNTYGRPLSTDFLKTAIALVNRFRNAAQTLYACRVVDPTLVSYSEVSRIMGEFLTLPNADTVDQISESVNAVSQRMDERGQLNTVKSLQQQLLSGTPSNVKIPVESKTPRVIVVGGMTEPQAIASLFNSSAKSGDAVVALDLLSFGFKTAFTPPVNPEGDRFVAMARSILNAPSEPTQEGLPGRLQFLKLLLSELSINGLVVCEQSFCEPDQFEAPSLLKVASEIGVPTIRLPIDPELSDRTRLEGRIQSFLETLEGDLRVG